MLHQQSEKSSEIDIDKIVLAMKKVNSTQTFLVNYRAKLIPIKVEEVSYFRISDGIVEGVLETNECYKFGDITLDEIEEKINRK